VRVPVVAKSCQREIGRRLADAETVGVCYDDATASRDERQTDGRLAGS
jgi:hypothetical protein